MDGADAIVIVQLVDERLRQSLTVGDQEHPIGGIDSAREHHPRLQFGQQQFALALGNRRLRSWQPDCRRGDSGQVA